MATISNRFDKLKSSSPAKSDTTTEIEKSDNSEEVNTNNCGIGERKRKNLPSVDSSEDSGSPISKKINQVELDNSFDISSGLESSSDKMHDILESIQKRLDTLATSVELNTLRENLRTKLSEDISGVSREISQLSKSMTERFEILEGRMFDAEIKIDAQDKENKLLKQSIEQLRDDLTNTRSEMNDQQQYQRRWNLRVFNVPEKPNETSKDTIEKLCDVFTNLVGVTTRPEDIEVAHRIRPVGEGGSPADVTMETAQVGEGGASGNGPAAQLASGSGTGGSNSSSSGKEQNIRKPIPIIVRFKFRGIRDNILLQRKNLKKNKSAVSISEDLTRYNLNVCNLAYKHPLTENSWSVAGKIWAKFKSGKKVKIPYGVDVNNFLYREARQ